MYCRSTEYPPSSNELVEQSIWLRQPGQISYLESLDLHILMGTIEVFGNHNVDNLSTIQLRQSVVSRSCSTEVDTSDSGAQSTALESHQQPLGHSRIEEANIFNVIVRLVGRLAKLARIIQYSRHKGVDRLQRILVDDNIRKVEDICDNLHMSSASGWILEQGYIPGPAPKPHRRGTHQESLSDNDAVQQG